MSVSRWCDYGDHAFKAGRKGTIMMGVLTGDNGEQDVNEMCPECAASLGLNDKYVAPLPPAERKKELLDRAMSERKEG